jgi:molybdenum cofactor synthesis domain-containing protein
MTVALLVVGNEILDGSTTDTNSGWVSRQIAGRGAGVVRTAVVPDDPREIAQGLDFLLQAAPRLVITLGGLGPTRDDLTAEAVAGYFGIETADTPTPSGSSTSATRRSGRRGESRMRRARRHCTRGRG